MAKFRLINNVSSLQLFQVLRFSVFLVISIVFTRSHLSAEDIGSWEMFMFIASVLSFFWITGIIQSLLPLYNRNKTYRRVGDNGKGKSPEIFNTFLLLLGFSLLFFVTGHILKHNFSVYGVSGSTPYLNLLLLYLLISSPVCLIEYIYLLRNKSYKILQYGLYTFIAQLALILIPVLNGRDIIWAIYGMLAISSLRWIWLILLLIKYAEWKISFNFMKEHLKLGIPLIIASLISGSAQYIDGIIVSAQFDDPRMFAIFRYGAKELPLVLLLANSLSNAMLPHFSTRENMREALVLIKEKSRRLMHYLFPISMALLILARWLYPRVFTSDFLSSADIFMIYLLLIIPRLIFPQTIIIGRKRTQITLLAAVFELSLNIPLSLWLVQIYGAVGVAMATFIVYFLEKVFLSAYVWIKMRIKPSQYIPLLTYLIYSVIIILVFILINNKVIDIH